MSHLLEQDQELAAEFLSNDGQRTAFWQRVEAQVQAIGLIDPEVWLPFLKEIMIAVPHLLLKEAGFSQLMESGLIDGITKVITIKQDGEQTKIKMVQVRAVRLALLLIRTVETNAKVEDIVQKLMLRKPILHILTGCGGVSEFEINDYLMLVAEIVGVKHEYRQEALKDGVMAYFKDWNISSPQHLTILLYLASKLTSTFIV